MADAASFRRLATRTRSFSSDGARYVAWQVGEGAPVVVLDALTGRETHAVVPSGCALADQGRKSEQGPPAAAGRFLLQCTHGKAVVMALLSAQTATVTMLPTPGLWQSVGALYVEGVRGTAATCAQTASERRNNEPCILLYEIATGVVSQRPQWQVGNIDQRGAPLVCPALRRTLLAERIDSRPYLFAYSDGQLARPARGHGGVQIDRCHGRRTILHARGEPVNFDLRGAVLTWDTGHNLETFNEDEEDISHGTAFSYGLAAHERHSWQLPRLPVGGIPSPTAVLGYSTHTANTILWVAPEDNLGVKLPQIGTSAVYATPLP
jgi:hypothetical protein